jgi:hypothetical protein
MQRIRHRKRNVLVQPDTLDQLIDDAFQGDAVQWIAGMGSG